MQVSAGTSRRSHVMVTLLLASLCLQTMSGCSRREWRQQAEQESYAAIAEKLNDERWLVPRLDTTADPRSRFYDPYDPDEEPLPPDDPAAHTYMHCVNGIRGSKHWGDFGHALSIENPSWLEPYSVLLQTPDPVAGHSLVNIPDVTLIDSLELAHIHSREYQTTIEDVYLAALTVTERRFDLETQFLVGAPIGGALFNSRVSSGSGNDDGSFGTGIGLTKLMPWGMQIGVDVLNSLTWGAGQGTSSATRLAWSVSQPLLRGGGRKVIMEQLTLAERDLLYQIRILARFRQTLFTSIASDYLAILRQQQNIINQQNNIRQLEEQIEVGQAADNRTPRQVVEPLLRFPEGVEIPESIRLYFKYDEDLKVLKWVGSLSAEQKEVLLNLSEDELYQTAVQQLIRWKETKVVSLRVAELITQLNVSQNNLEDANRALADLKDAFKIRLGMPPNISLSIDDAWLAPFQLIDPLLVEIEEELKDFAKTQGANLIPTAEEALPDEPLPPDFDALRQYVEQLNGFSEKVQSQGLDLVRADFVPVRELLADTADQPLAVIPGQRYFKTEEERERVLKDVARDQRLFQINEREYKKTDDLIQMLRGLLARRDLMSMFQSLDTNGDNFIGKDELPAGWRNLPRAGEIKDDLALSPEEFLSGIRNAAIGLREELLQIAQSIRVVQVGLRVELVKLNPFRLPGESETPDIEKVVEVGLQNRHDLMNARAAVMDARRAVEVAANALLSTLDLTASGGGNPLADDATLGVEFTSPLTQITERNNYNEALIVYQRARRTYMALEDGVKEQIRRSWRQLMVSEQQLEIDRQTVRNAALQYDSASLTALGGGQGNSFSILQSLNSVLNAQNSLVRDWVTYETNRLNIFRDMGIMQIDPDGVWEDDFYLKGGQLTSDDMPAPTELYPQLQSDPPPPAPSTPLPPETPDNE